MNLDNYKQEIVASFCRVYNFSNNELEDVEFLKSIDNKPENLQLLNQYMSKGDAESIKNFISDKRKTTYDDYTYLLIKFKAKSFIVCVWDSDELWDDPIIISFKEI